jgi:ribonuclease HI
VVDFIVDHMVGVEGDTRVVEISLWELYFDGSACGKGQGVGCVLRSSSGAMFGLSLGLEFACMNNQVEYEALIYGLEYLRDLWVIDVNVFGDSMLIVQQIKGESQWSRKGRATRCACMEIR